VKYAWINEQWVFSSDITYIWTGEGWLYLAVTLDLCNAPGALHHSDRGSQYASHEFHRKLIADSVPAGSTQGSADEGDGCITKASGRRTPRI
jgi:transposase InsO family protein